MVSEPGSRLVEELRLLMEAMADRAGPWLDRVAVEEHQDGGVCRWCPLCALVAVARGEPSELATRGLEGAADLVAVLRAVLADRWDPGKPHMPGFTPAARQNVRVQRIPVRREGDPC